MFPLWVINLENSTIKIAEMNVLMFVDIVKEMRHLDVAPRQVLEHHCTLPACNLSATSKSVRCSVLNSIVLYKCHVFCVADSASAVDISTTGHVGNKESMSH